MSDLMQEIFNLGYIEGLRRVEAENEARGIAIGEAKGEAKTLIKNINSLLKNGMQLEEILSILKVSKEEYEQTLQFVKSLDAGN